jgi:antitoxin component YwqK of YwqJK toxin-antitoxin module
MTKLNAPVLAVVGVVAVGAIAFATSLFPEHPQPLVFDQLPKRTNAGGTAAETTPGASAKTSEAGGEHDDAGRKHGEWREPCEDGGHEIGRYAHGAREGTWTRWRGSDRVGERNYENGQLHGLCSSSSPRSSLTITYVRGTEHGPCTSSQFNRATRWSTTTAGEYQHGKRVGIWKTETTSAGERAVTKSEEHYRSGDKVLSRSWHANGQLAAETYYRQGEKHGVESQWHANGRIERETPYVHGKKSGTERVFFANGRPALEAEFRNGEEFGTFRRWSEDGSLDAHWVTSENGRKVFVMHGAAPGR